MRWIKIDSLIVGFTKSSPAETNCNITHTFLSASEFHYRIVKFRWHCRGQWSEINYVMCRRTFFLLCSQMTSLFAKAWIHFRVILPPWRRSYYFQRERKLRVRGRMLWPIIGEDRVKNEQQNFCTIYAQFVISEVLKIEIV